MAQATLYNPTTNVRKAVEAGSPEAQALFGQGYALETSYNPKTGQTIYNGSPAKAEAPAPVLGSAWQQTSPVTSGTPAPATTTPNALRYRLTEDGTPQLTAEQAQAKRELSDADKAKLREEVYTGVQTQLDAIDLAAKNILARYATQEQGTLGRNRAVAAAGGSIGSPNQNAEIAGINEDFNEKERQAMALAEADKAAIRSNAEARLQNRIQTERTNRISDFEFAQQWDEKKQNEIRELVADYVKTGNDIGKYSDEELKDLQKQTGWSPLQFELIVQKNKPAAAQIDYDFSWKGDTLVGYGVDPKTGQVVTKKFSADEIGIAEKDRTKSLKFITNPDTQEVYYYDEKNPDRLTKIGQAGTGQKLTTKEVNVGKTTYLITYDQMGNEVKRENMGMGGGGGSGTTPSSNNYDELKAQLEASKGPDGYINTDEYKRLRNSLKTATQKTSFDKDFSYMLRPDDPGASDYVKKSDILESNTKKVNSALYGLKDIQGFVEPDIYNSARNAWQSDGMNVADFDKQFSHFANPAKKKEYQGVKTTAKETETDSIDWGDAKKTEKKFWEFWK